VVNLTEVKDAWYDIDDKDFRTLWKKQA